MIVKSLSLENYRNLEKTKIDTYEEVNIIYGENAQGKTNLLESLWLFTGGRSFRGAKDSELIKFGCKESRIETDFFSNGRDQTSGINISGKKRTAVLNGVPKITATQLIGSYCAVVFSPIHLSLVKDGPSQRRKFIDSAICQIKPSYVKLLMRYNHTLSQRNTLLKDIPRYPELVDTIDIWDEKLCEYGSSLILERIKYIDLLKKHVYGIYSGISGCKEELEVDYDFIKDIKNIDISGIKSLLSEKIKEKRKSDINLGFTTYGPHRDDLDIKLNEKSARIFASQGQQRSCVLSLKIAEASVIGDIKGEKPIILLDDVLSELDNLRQNYILNCLKNWQVFITCCEPSVLIKLTQGKTFKIEQGKIS